ncbi:MAG TPA: response regulator [Anaeromyxobacteraceae bacterium]|nr:response regulator [Anaeromyxobacteraceae bacterium]
MQTRAQMPGRVLVADDEPSVRDLLTRVLGNAGHEVAAVESGEAALVKLARERFDLLVVDKNLPGMDGLDVMRLVRDHHPHLRAIMITAFPTAASEEVARGLGVHAYVAKPFGIVTIVSAVDEAIRAGRAGR